MSENQNVQPVVVMGSQVFRKNVRPFAERVAQMLAKFTYSFTPRVIAEEETPQIEELLAELITEQRRTSAKIEQLTVTLAVPMLVAADELCSIGFGSREAEKRAKGEKRAEGVKPIDGSDAEQPENGQDQGEQPAGEQVPF